MLVNRRLAMPVLLTVTLGAGMAVTAAGCGGPSPAKVGSPAATDPPASPAATDPPASPAATPPGSPTTAALLASLISCLQSHGVTVADGVQFKQVKVVFKARPIAQQQRDFAGCGPLLPASISQKVRERIADEEAAAPTASP